MDAKELKSSLKEAREAIKNKDFGTSMKICKNILKSDKENYMALVFFGLSLQEVGPRDQAPLAFRKAILSSPDQILAWAGLANYYEKDESDTASKELISVYEKLLDIESDASKVSDLCDKLVVRGVKVHEITKCTEILKKLGNNEKTSENNRRIAWVALVSLLLQCSDLSTELLITLEGALSSLIKDRASVTVDYYKEYLKLLYKLKKYKVLFDEAVNMQSLYESNVYPLEWICKIYVELVIENNPTVNAFADKMEQYCHKLSGLQENATMVIFTQAVDAFKSGNYIDARDHLKKVVTIRAGLTHAWVLLAECCLKLHCYDESLRTATRSDKLLQSMTKTNDNLRKKIDNILMLSLSRHTDSEKWIQAVELCTTLLEQSPDDVDTLVALSISYINLGKYDDAKEYMRRLKKNGDNIAILALLSAKLLHKQGELEKAVALLKSVNVESCELYMEMGMLHWELQQYDLCLVPFLKAAKLDANYFMCFIYLARYYEQSKDLEKARRCYQKAFKINPRCLEAGMGLSNIYRQQKNWAANLELLQSVTGTNTVGGLHMIGTDVRWAWLQLGLHYLEQSENNDAIDCLRSVIRAEPDNGHYWECLADAYMSRGAYTAALKSYERSAELCENVTYPKLQVASIKLLLGNYCEAKLEFEEVLTENERYVPALKGLAENCLNLAYDQRKAQFLGLCRDNSQNALNSLTQALKERNDLSCIWKLTGDSCALVASLSDKYCHMLVDSLLAEGQEDGKPVEFDRLQLYKLATRCYCKAISLAQTNILLWHDLAICYYSQGCCEEDPSQRRELLYHALVTSKYCVSKSSDNWEHWNLLGIVAVHKDVRNYALAQHAFIKAVTLENNSAVAWCNLGTLYLMLGDLRLANKAYSEAQRSDPDYVNCWVGQALIAESVGHEDAMDLFRHSTQLGHHSQGAIGYAQWVCRTVIEAPPRAILYSIHNMHAIPIACDAITWYTENNPGNPCAWNLLGLLRERLGLKTSSIDAFKKSMALVDEKNRDKVLINCGRILVKVKEYEEAIQLYRQVKEASFNGGCSLALALFKAKQYPESYDSYDTTMQWLAQSEKLQSHVLVALAAMAYMFQGQDSAKNLLFQSTQLKPPSQWGLFATLSLGLLHGDFGLAQLVLKELQPMKDDPDVLYHYSVLLSLTYLLQGDKKSAIRSLTKSVHRHPGQASLWLFLSIMLLLLDPSSKSRAADNCAQVSMKLGRSQMDVSKVLCIVSLATCVSKEPKKALCAAQRAVHCYPDVAESWAVLISALKMVSYHDNKWHRRQEWIQAAKKHLNDTLNPSKNLVAWLSSTNDN